ncbi:glucan biosynthesis protein [Devosia nitrariae]|uniref:Glucans biosynthesis protein G n=1 Tax=Devosia nitrariae TaxID=2071872 RepID=A0ABQ5WCM7_9HYPH|nr:glucan biosynthesis protein [Devosia nitrariae]GLQ57868.1 glucans biosynthesis protein G [Devosia nitrariae]
MQSTPPSPSLSRRALLGAFGFGAALLSSTALTRLAFGQDAEAPPEPFEFSFDILTEAMRQRAETEYRPVIEELPDYVEELDYDSYRRIQFRRERGKWADSDSPFHLQAYHLGWLFKEPVHVFEVNDGKAGPFVFTANDFEFHDRAVATAADGVVLPGVAGIRLNYPLNTPETFDELISFLGASYFRALGRGNAYGLSARGLLLNSWRDGPEEFPRFTDFYVERPVPGEPMTVYAALDSQSVTGAYRFVISPPSEEVQETVVEVTARLFFRQDVAELGIAPLTSMFLFAESNRSDFDDYRPQVHDSNGLFLRRSNGEPMWRALNNPPTLGNSYFGDVNPLAFGLEQRGRSFEEYQDSGAHYERRPSLRVEPVGEWGEGAVRLIEVPADLEAEDNIVAFWVPAEPATAGTSREFSYLLRWGDLLPDSPDWGHVVETRTGQGGVSGVENAETLRKFVIDFAGGPLADLDPEAEPELAAEVSGAELLHATVSRIDANGVWRAVIDVDAEGSDLVELVASVRDDSGRKLTETWLYQWRARHEA